MDVLINNDDVIFSYRVAGILIHNDKVLLQRPENDDYAIIGGHVSLLETSVETLKREYQEELHTKIEVDNLMAIGEIFFLGEKENVIRYVYIIRFTLLMKIFLWMVCFMALINLIMKE